MITFKRIPGAIHNFFTALRTVNVTFGKPLCNAPDHCLVFFPADPLRLNCGISALVSYKGKKQTPGTFDPGQIQQKIQALSQYTLAKIPPDGKPLDNFYLGGQDLMDSLFAMALDLKTEPHFFSLCFHRQYLDQLSESWDSLEKLIKTEKQLFKDQLAKFSISDVGIISGRIEQLQDIAWCLKKEIMDNMENIRNLADMPLEEGSLTCLKIYRRINAVLNSMDRLEVRGRDSAGISILFTFTRQIFDSIKSTLKTEGLGQALKQRVNRQVLTNNTITIHDTRAPEADPLVSMAFVYKFAAEIGALGDNITFIRNQIKNDTILQLVTGFDRVSSSISAHTRWASVGEITEANCHPVDNEPNDTRMSKSGIIHVCLNGDIDNYLELKTEYEATYDKIHENITTDTKLIPLQIEHYLKKGNPVEEAFRLAVNDFEGSHAISMHTDLAPGKLFLAQKGSGQALFVGIGTDHYMAASELYGIVEETREYIKLNGETSGQIMILDQGSGGGIKGISSFYYNSDPIEIQKRDIQTSRITSRDIDRQHYPHYFLKEIFEAPRSVEKTLENKFNRHPDTHLYVPVLDNFAMPADIEDELKNGQIRNIFFIGQGTAGVAAKGCAELLDHYLGGHDFFIRALKSSELSGFAIKGDHNEGNTMSDTLVVAISQAGTTTDTNRTVDMARACGARTLCIVNRRDSDLTFKANGVLYTSSGRDIEMSVASTKAFYSQIAAGAVLGLYMTHILKARPVEFINEEIHELLQLPDKMRTILSMAKEIKSSAGRLAATSYYWATVGSGANKTAADEIRIKLSELCYKTISSDYIEDKKHIDLSSEPLIIICAAGTRESVLKDIIKDTAIFKAHKATPVVITTQDENRFDPYAIDVFKIPETREHLAPVLNTLVGHLWGYYAALSFNEGSEFMYNARMELQEILDEYTAVGHDLYEVLLEKKFREKVAHFSNDFSKKRKNHGFPPALGMHTSGNLILLLKYLSGRLPVSDFEIDFEIKGTPANMLNAFYENIGHAINAMARPVDAIKHQAKTVTVGTSRVAETFEGLLFDALSRHEILVSQITNKNVLVMKNLQEVIAHIKGSLLYQISGLNLLGEPNAETSIRVVRKTGSLKNEISRVETDPRLKGTKNIIVREGNVYIGKGRKDQKNILVIPVISSSPATPNIIEYILSLNVEFKNTADVSLLKKIKALGGKYTRLKDWTMEAASVPWDDKYLNLIELEDLFGNTAEKVVEAILEKMSDTPDQTRG